MKKLLWLALGLLLLGACNPGPASVHLFPSRAMVGEEVTATLRGASPEGAKVEVEGTQAEVVRIQGNTLSSGSPRCRAAPDRCGSSPPAGSWNPPWGS